MFFGLNKTGDFEKLWALFFFFISIFRFQKHMRSTLMIRDGDELRLGGLLARLFPSGSSFS